VELLDTYIKFLSRDWEEEIKMSVSSLYSSMDATEIEHDRRAINAKLRRHQSSRRNNLITDERGDEMNKAPSLRRSPSDNERGNVDRNEQEEGAFRNNDFLEEEDNDDQSLLLMKSALRQDGHRNFMPTSGTSISLNREEGHLEIEMGRKRRHNETISPIMDITLPRVIVDISSVTKNQPKEKTEVALLYILLCMALLVSYAFFLESCKLMNYGTR